MHLQDQLAGMPGLYCRVLELHVVLEWLHGGASKVILPELAWNRAVGGRGQSTVLK